MINGVLMIILTAFISNISIKILMWASFEVKLNTYSDILEHCYGKV